MQITIFEEFTKAGYMFEDIVGLMAMTDADADDFVKLHAAGFDRMAMMPKLHQDVVNFQVRETMAGRNFLDHTNEWGDDVYAQLAVVQNTPAYSMTQDGLVRGYGYVWHLGAGDKELRRFLEDILHPAWSDAVNRPPHECQIHWPLVYAPKSPDDPDPESVADPEISSDQAPPTQGMYNHVPNHA